MARADGRTRRAGRVTVQRVRTFHPFIGSIGHGVHVVAVGCCSPVGYSAPATIAAMRAGVSGQVAHPFLIDKGGSPFIVAAVEQAERRSLAERLSALAGMAIREALAPLMDSRDPGTRVPILVGTRERMVHDGNIAASLSQSIAGQVAALGLHMPVFVLEEGGASGSIAVQTACSEVAAGRTELALAGGVDSFIDWDVLEPLESAERIHSSVSQFGFCPGEAAAFCLLASDRAVRERGWNPLARMLAAATALEPHPIGTESVCIGEGMTAAMRQVLAVLAGRGRRVERLMSDMNGEPYRGDEFGFSMVRVSNHFVDGIDAETPADGWGNIGAATGPMLLALATAPAPDNGVHAHGAVAMAISASDSGYRTALLMAVPD